MKHLYTFEDKSYYIKLGSSPLLFIKNNNTDLTILTLTYYDLVFISSKLNVITNITNMGLDMNTLIQRINQGSFNFTYSTEELINIDFKLSFDHNSKKILSNISIEGYIEYQRTKWDSIKFISEMFNSIKIGWFVLVSSGISRNNTSFSEDISCEEDSNQLEENKLHNAYIDNCPKGCGDDLFDDKKDEKISLFTDIEGFESDELRISNSDGDFHNSADFTNSQHNINPLEMF